mmetsp:Transcript_6374/g.11040  ORF Transcript_6374/g.11040 Transcript_6374/m.11040 type:complete len:311 (+) Transcript_6374:365-1297(+)|eukprot:CAMPEP_0198199258 /NCGR_PEP_ID=MMETSP1445-20131203/2574_1 /TAXON_ID=36898 /ORGANISM="Pyramimonas sp., Strain CCMP2087" /LENGTH=310 /DNA_ID=CAMNT_0043869043 /DNA_START=358 /DNA_END=1290 /DNA_ORIENTATION=+
MEQAVRCEGEASPAVQSDCENESEPLRSNGDNCNSSHNHVIHVDDANEESDGNDEENESLPLLQSSSSEAPLHFDPLKMKPLTSKVLSSNKLTGDCRICQETDPVELLDTPCVCTGSMLYAHKGCIQHWINEKGDKTCEVCHTNFQGDYEDPPSRATFPGLFPPFGVFDAARLQEAAAAMTERMSAEAEEERQLVYARYPRFLCLRLTIVFILSLFLMRIFFTVADEDSQNQESSSGGATLFIAQLIRLLGPLIPFILMYQTIVTVRRQQLSVADFALVVRDGQHREPRSIRRAYTLRPTGMVHQAYQQT